MDIHQTSNKPSVTGQVFITGAGPGDPDLITLKGVKALQSADVVVYDRLANPELLSHAPDSAEKIYVGKKACKRSVSQSQINDILIARARDGKTVVRLKGGDPFVFGRGGEECEALRAAGVRYQVIPGISSALSAPAYAGIPVTHRKLGRSFTVVTGHTLKGSDDFANWEHLSKVDTLVILMGLRNLKAITSKLMEHGRHGSTPAAIVASATHGYQSVVAGTLQSISESADGLESPATIVIGELAAMHHDLAWFDPANHESPLASEEKIAEEIQSTFAM